MRYENLKHHKDHISNSKGWYSSAR